MKIPPKVRWITALLFLAIASQALVFAPGLHNFSVIFWGLSFTFLIGALVIAVMRFRDDRMKQRK